ncbi:DUF3716 domain-containing protein [Aspergillus mulundensis]|uniref:Uncharacterized protein n=1 Tax=Aspergillus mulundensis TaxID=1810919 RepID=A0A3D8RYV4_9EURO|nr:hypothetical protein DSM5745_06067 [Aspergillus mulundensis]RDW79215.1 hypothetical protein DSM5745_06067 [Aspergillus mulundensis]
MANQNTLEASYGNVKELYHSKIFPSTYSRKPGSNPLMVPKQKRQPGVKKLMRHDGFWSTTGPRLQPADGCRDGSVGNIALDIAEDEPADAIEYQAGLWGKVPVGNGSQLGGSEIPDLQSSTTSVTMRESETHRVYAIPAPHEQPREQEIPRGPAEPTIPNVLASNLPIDPVINRSQTIAYYRKLAVLRYLEWRDPANLRNDGGFGPRGTQGPDWTGSLTDLDAAFIQTRGREAIRPCVACAEGRGLWRTCVEKLGEKNNGVCANCRQHKGYCSNYIDGWTTGNKTPGHLNDHANEAKTHTIPGTGTCAIPNQNRTLTLDVLLPPSRARTVTPMPEPNRFDEGEYGQVVAFPLSGEDISDLSLLVEAAKDVRKHVKVILMQREKLLKEAAERARMHQQEQEPDLWGEVWNSRGLR